MLARHATGARHRTPAPSAHEIEPVSGLVGPLPDPTPPKLRLRPTVAQALLAISRRRGIDWPVLLAAARARGLQWTRLRPARLAAVARRLAHERAHRQIALPEEAALARYAAAVGLDALVSGLGAARSVLAARVLRDPHITIYPAGRSDIASGRVDVHVLALLLYLARSEGSVGVSSLVSGHAPPGEGRERSGHAFGVAVDLRAVAGKPVFGHQSVPGPVERAIRAMLLLPPEARPLQIISLLALGGPSVALADHDRVVHVGFDPTVTAGRDGYLELLWRSAGATYGVPWQVLAAINELETKNGAFLHVSPAGAVGWMQFMPATWRRYGLDADGNGTADPLNPTDAIFSAARYLAASGAASSLPRAIWAYNHAQWYVDDVLERSQRIEQAAH